MPTASRATGASAIQVNTGRAATSMRPWWPKRSRGRCICMRTTTTMRPCARPIMITATATTTPTRCSSSRTSATSSARRCGIWARRAKIAILSVTEGEDKPLKYPDMFAAARLMVLNKTDLLPYLDRRAEVHRARAPRQPGHRGAAGVGEDRRRHGRLGRVAAASAPGRTAILFTLPPPRRRACSPAARS